MEEYDTIIVGAGPAGGSCARELSKRGRSVLLLERSKVIGEPNFSTGGTPNETMKIFNLPTKITDSPWSSLLIASKNKRAEFVYKKRMGYVLNYKLLKQFLAKEIEKKKSQVISGANVTDVIFENGFVKGVKFNHDGESKEVFAKVVVDATGGRSTLSQKLGLIKFERNSLAVGLEHHMDNVNLERKGRLDFYLGPDFPGGYAWIFPMGINKAKVGVGVLSPTGRNSSADSMLKYFVKNNSQTKSAVIINTHGGSLLANGGIKNHVKNGFIAIGDSAIQVNPLGGEGIRHALQSGRFAAEVIDSALRKGEFGEKYLKAYDEMWKKYIGNKWKICAMLQKSYSSILLNQKLTDATIRRISRASPETIFEALFNYKFDIWKVL